MVVPNDWIESAARSVDKLVTFDPRETGSHNQPALVDELYRAAVADAGGSLTLGAARALIDAISPNDTVLIVTGAGVPPWLPYGETDGPLGAVALSYALARALDARPVLAIEERSTEPLVASAHACGLITVDDEVLQRRNTAVSVVSHPEGPERGDGFADRVFNKYDPKAVIAVEKLAPNSDGVFPQGDHYKNRHAHAAPLFDRAAERGVLSVGVGDRGNEIGFGTIEDEVRSIRDHAPESASGVETDHLVVGGTSNWGAYGIEAMIALLTERPEAIHSPEDERRMLNACTMGGATDATTHLSHMTVDGTSAISQSGIVALLSDLVTNRLSRYDKWEQRDNVWEEDRVD